MKIVETFVHVYNEFSQNGLNTIKFMSLQNSLWQKDEPKFYSQ